MKIQTIVYDKDGKCIKKQYDCKFSDDGKFLFINGIERTFYEPHLYIIEGVLTVFLKDFNLNEVYKFSNSREFLEINKK